MGTDGEQTLALASTGQNDSLPGSDQGQIELQEIRVEVKAEEIRDVQAEEIRAEVKAEDIRVEVKAEEIRDVQAEDIRVNVQAEEIGVDVQAEETHNLMSNGDVTQEVSKRSCLLSVFQLRNLPIATFVWILLSFIICYCIAVGLDHEEPFFPYISHTAVHVPERSIFSQMVNLGAFMLAANMYIKYLQVQAVILTRSPPLPRTRALNIASIIVGFVSALGLTMVANFQTREMREVHYTGAILAFLSGVIYCWIQTSLSIKHRPWSKITIWQFMHSILLTVCSIIFFICKTVYKIRESAGHGTKHDTLRIVYLWSTISEWLTAIFTISYVLTYYRDFSHVSFNFPSVRIKNEQNHHSNPEQNGRVYV